MAMGLADEPSEPPGPASVGQAGQLVPLSFAQQRLWLMSQIFPDSPFYHVPTACRLKGNIDINALAGAFTELVARHNVLRACYRRGQDGTPEQIISPPWPMRIPVTEITGSTDQERITNAQQVARNRSRELFDLNSGPVIRAELLRLAPDDHILLVVMHHIVADHWSLGVMADEISALYAAHLTGTATPAQARPRLLRQYADYAELQAARLGNGAFEQHLSYWREQLAGLVAPIIPGDWPRPPVPDFVGGRVSVTMPPELLAAMRVFARDSRVTVFATMLAGLKVLLSRYCGTDDMAIGCAMANRSIPEFEPLIGAFVDTVVLRTNLSGDPAFADLARRVQRVTLAAYDHRDLPFEKLVEVFAPDRDLSYTPFFNVAVSYLSAPSSGFKLPGVTTERFTFDASIVRFDLDVFISESRGTLTVEADYRADLFERRTIERMLDHYIHLLASATEHPATPISHLAMHGPAGVRQVSSFGENARPHPRTPLVPEIIAERAAQSPGAPAIVFVDQVVSYAELDQRAEQIAERLRRHGVAPDTLVGVGLERSADVIVAMLGVLKAGAGYLALDPGHPADRLAYMVRDSGIGIVIATPSAASAARFGAAIIVDPDDDSPAAYQGAISLAGPSPASLAYAIYTSGSTGQPKGVLLEHRGLLNLCLWHNDRFGVTAADVGTLVSALTFDASVWEIWPYLIAGARVCIADGVTRTDPDLLSAWLRDQGATIMFASTPMAELLMARADASDSPLRTLLTGGDTLRRRPPPDARFELVNQYGPTEGTVVATSGAVAPASPSASGKTPDIGRPIHNVRTAVLDQHMRPVPVGLIGELYIGGAGVARGYLHRPALTAERFVPDPFGPAGSRLYRTGDLVRWRADGTLEFAGRNDRQIKIRGFRIEPGEIEAELCRHDLVTDAIVTVVSAADRSETKRLAAYLTTVDDVDPGPGALRAHLQRRLPDYMIPASFTVLPILPVTPNGKIDYSALPDPPVAVDEAVYRPPRTDPERRLEIIFNEVFERPMTSIDDDFFDLGGHSVLAVMLVSRIQREFGVKLPVRTVFRMPTIEGLGAEITSALAQQDADDVNRRLLQKLSAMPEAQARELLESFRASS